ncbi:MAG: hypothetical protein KF887_07155 [Paracoccaceae bacterium]|nr:MAG: hypothetical protein KF887_07155 [Paracoccaceae bacterium]
MAGAVMAWRALLILLALAGPAHAGPVAALVGLLTGAAGFTGAITLGAFWTSVGGRLLVTVVLTALSRARVPRARDPGLQTRVTQAGGTNPATVILGRYATGGTAVCPPMSHGPSNRDLTYVIDLADMPIHGLSRLAIDGEWVELDETPDGDGFLPVLGRFAGKARIKVHDGTQTAADPWLLATYADYPERPWSEDMVGTGVAYAILVFRYDREVYQNLPKVLFEIDGSPLYDPREDSTVGGSGDHRRDDPDSWAFTLNPVVMAYNIRTGLALPDGSVWGGGDPVELPLSNWMAAMNACDEPVDIGDEATEPQYRAGFEVRLDDEPAAVIEELMKACAGAVSEAGGRCRVRVGPPGLPAMVITDADVLVSRPQDYDPFPGLQTTFNGVTAAHPSPDALWEATDAPPLHDAAFEAADGGRRLPADLSLPAVPYGLQVQRLMRAALSDHRRMLRHGLSLPPAAAALEPLDTLAWTSARNGYDGKLFDIGQVADEALSLVQAVALREVDPDDWLWDPETAVIVAPVSGAVVPPVAATVDGFAATAITLGDGDTDRRAAIRLDWDAGSAAGATALSWELRLEGGATVLQGTTAAVLTGALVLADGVLPATDYEVRARWLDDRPPAWTDWEPVTTDAVGLSGEDVAEGAVTRRAFLSRTAVMTISPVGADMLPGLGSATGYTLGTNIAITGGEIVVTASGANRQLTYPLTLTPGESYRHRFTVATRSGGAVAPQLRGGTLVPGTSRTSVGTFDETLVAVTGNTEGALQFNSAAAMTLSAWSIRPVTVGAGSAVTVSGTTEYDPAAYLGDPAAPRNPVVAKLGATIRPVGPEAGSIVLMLQRDAGSGWSDVQSFAFAFPAAAAPIYALRQVIFSADHGHTAIPTGAADYRLVGYVTSGSPAVEIEDVAMILEQLSR